MKENFEWDMNKNIQNIKKHGVSFDEAQYAFADSKRVIAQDISHSHSEARYFCFAKIDADVITVRFTYRNNVIRIFGAGYWRKGKKIYETKNKIH